MYVHDNVMSVKTTSFPGSLSPSWKRGSVRRFLQTRGLQFNPKTSILMTPSKKIRAVSDDCLLHARESKQAMTTTAMKTPPNKISNERNNDCAPAL